MQPGSRELFWGLLWLPWLWPVGHPWSWLLRASVPDSLTAPSISEELEADLASGDQSLPMGVLGTQTERFPSNLEVEASPQASSKREQPTHLDSGRCASLSTSCILDSKSGDERTKIGMGRGMESRKRSIASLI